MNGIIFMEGDLTVIQIEIRSLEQYRAEDNRRILRGDKYTLSGSAVFVR